MKTKKTILAMAALLIGSITMNLQAQENLNALFKKCESMDNVNMNVIYDKDRETKKAEKIIKTIGFKNNPQLVNEFLAAFNKDKEAAYKVIEEKKNGKVMPSFYRFAKGKGDVSFTFSISGENEVSVTMIERFD